MLAAKGMSWLGGWLRVATALLLMPLGGGCARAAEQAPNVVWVVADSLRWDRVGVYRPGTGLTPFLDQLAQRSHVYWRAYATSPWTLPSVASMFTSQYPWAHGVNSFRSVLTSDSATLSEVLQAAGYFTLGITANPLLREESGFARGFDEWRVVTDEISGGKPLQKIRADRVQHVLEETLKRASAASGKPLFLYLHLMDTHFLYVPPQESLDAVLRQAGNQDELRVAITNLFFDPRNRWQEPSELERQAIVTLYDAEVKAADESLARIFALLSHYQLLNRALVVVTADHGEELHEHGKLGHGHALREELIRVPLFVSFPGQRTRTDVHQTVSLIDLAPTVLDVAGCKVPDSMAGSSLRAPAGWWAWLRRHLWQTTSRPVYSGRLTTLSGASLNAEAPSQRLAAIEGGWKLMEYSDRSRELFQVRAQALAEEHARNPEAMQRLHQHVLAIEALVSAARPGPTVTLDEATQQRLRALGYHE